MARLTGKGIDEIVASPIETAAEFAKETGVVVLLKGAASVVANPEGIIYLTLQAMRGWGLEAAEMCLLDWWLALIAQGYSPYEAAVYGCYIHGRAE